MPTMTFQALAVNTGSRDRTGRLAFCDDELVAVLVRLDAPGHLPTQRGRWFLEAGFGPCSRNQVPSFHDLDEATAWINRQVGSEARPAPALRLVCNTGD